MRYAIAPFNHIYLVSEKQHLFSREELAAVENTLGFPLPEVHKQLLRILGHGLYCDHIRLFSPEEILVRNPIPRSTEESTWASHSRLVTPEIITSSIVLADTIDGDHIIVSPHAPDKVYILLRGYGYQKACIAPRGFRDLMLWIDEESRFESAAPVSYFTSWIDRQEYGFTATDTTLLLPDVAHAIERAIHGRIHLQSAQSHEEGTVTLCFIPEMHGLFSFVEEVDHGTADLRIHCYLEYDTDFEDVAQRVIEQLKNIGFQ